MSPEVLAVVISALGLLITICLALFGFARWIITSVESRLAAFESKINTAISELRAEVEDLGRRVSRLEIAVARLEGPPPRIQVASR